MILVSKLSSEFVGTTFALAKVSEWDYEVIITQSLPGAPPLIEEHRFDSKKDAVSFYNDMV